ncbi:hypothetical protein ACIBUY_04005 [Streptomyces sp. NPDC050085]|uniref:hypothetical protein n=1 Tax=Streptomyces sp. NPDC050085 TaxID=3365600 RepID=UPI0037B2DFCB
MTAMVLDVLWFAVIASGHDTHALLISAAAARELDSASRLSDVLVWRLRRAARLADDPAHPDGTQGSTRRTSAARDRQSRSR